MITPSGRRQLNRTGAVLEGIVRDLFEPHVTDDDVAALIRILSKIVVGSRRWADRAAGMEFERSIRRAGQPSVRLRA